MPFYVDVAANRECTGPNLDRPRQNDKEDSELDIFQHDSSESEDDENDSNAVEAAFPDADEDASTNNLREYTSRPDVNPDGPEQFDSMKHFFKAHAAVMYDVFPKELHPHVQRDNRMFWENFRDGVNGSRASALNTVRKCVHLIFPNFDKGLFQASKAEARRNSSEMQKLL
ncbi:hypothetical protein WOLCODRAFT_150033 [Wolfiporia cocos MD-104 SS10]|uniref:Uncharacterized protein n=1 Tax=Wolfiporia cocos (strain MD-104) TaxID=742152 RepID=A0A2H3JDM7_WOLCO|nr:hypothetical protein WOLCODRAFT_150033 [Wolfiporia cocos MD-104 SS10]